MTFKNMRFYANTRVSKSSRNSIQEKPILTRVIKELQEGDTLIVTKLDRLARNTVEGIQIVENLFNKGIAVHALNIGLLENTSMGKFFLATLLAIAEMERNTILERTHAGKEIARQKPDYREGRPKKYTSKQMEHAIELLETNSLKQVEALTGISKSTFARAKKIKVSYSQSCQYKS